MKQLEGWIGAALANEKTDAEISVRLVDEAEGRALNRQYRGKDKATNVLSFPAELPPEVDSPLLGDLAVCLDVVEREAAEQGKPLGNHLAHLLIHGTLHLLGYEHDSSDGAKVMEIREIELLAGFGIGNPYEL